MQKIARGVKNKNGINMFLFVCFKMPIYTFSIVHGHEFEFTTLADMKRCLREMREHIISECRKQIGIVYELDCYLNPCSNTGIVKCNMGTINKDLYFDEFTFASGAEMCVFGFE